MTAKQKIILKRSIYAFFIIVLIYGLYRLGDKAYRLYEKAQITVEMSDKYKSFANQCLGDINPENHSLVLDTLRDCVHQNSKHSMDDEFYAIARKAGKGVLANRSYAEEVIKYAKGKRDTRPHLECSKRARTLTSLYNALGYKARHIRVSAYAANFPDHVLSEVYNPQTQDWEFQDPSFNVHIKNIKSQKRLSLKELIQTDNSELVPCQFKNNCGWKQYTHDGYFHTNGILNLTGIAFLGSYDDIRRGPLIYNPEKFPIENPISYDDKDYTYCDLRPRHCKKIINVLEEDYSYEGVNPKLF